MQCKCIEDVTAKLKAHAAEKMKAVNPTVSMDNVGIDLRTGKGLLSLPFTVRAENRPFNTRNGQSVNMVASFCPFCGVPAEAKQVVETA